MNTERITFERLCKVAPELAQIRKDAVRQLSNDNMYDFWERYENIKARMSKYVGWYACNYPEFMQSPDAFDVAHKAIFGGLV